MSSALPGGTVTFVFTDLEGSTALLKRLGDGYADVARHAPVDRPRGVRSRGGVEIDTQGDAFFFSFTRATDASPERLRRSVAWRLTPGRTPWSCGCA